MILEQLIMDLIQQNGQKLEYKSLYEYLGKAAGKELGQQVFSFAKLHKIKPTSKQINQGGYNGVVMCYPVDFLEEYFEKRGEFQFYKKYFI